MDTLLRFLSSGRGGPCSRPGGVSDLIKEEAVPISPRASIDVLLKERKVWRRMAQLLLLQMLGLRKNFFERKRLNHFQCCDLELKIKMLMFANIILVGISDSYFLSVNGSVFFNNALICYMMILFGFYGLASSASVVIGGKLCQETSGHGRKPDEPHNFGAPKELMERVHVSSTGHQRLPADPNGLTTLEERMERVHVSSTGIHQRERPTLHKSPTVNSCCDHVCTGRSTLWISTGTPSQQFYMDSGACCHSTGDPSVLQGYPDYLNVKAPITSLGGFVNGPPVPVEGCGYVNRDGVMKLDGVLYIPCAPKNLVSVGQLAKQYGVRTVFDKDFFRVEKLQQNGETIGQGHREKDSNHYVLDYFLPGDLFVEDPAPIVPPDMFGNVQPQQ